MTGVHAGAGLRSSWYHSEAYFPGVNGFYFGSSDSSGVLNVLFGGRVASNSINIGRNGGSFDLSAPGGTVNVHGSSGNYRCTLQALGRTDSGELYIGTRGTLNASSGGLVLVSDTLRVVGSEFVNKRVVVNLNAGGTIQTHHLHLQAGLFSEGTTSPGHSPDLLTVVGDFTQTGTGVYEVQLAGLLAGGEYDHWRIQGDAILADRLDVAIGPGFHLAVGRWFDILTVEGTSSGRFDNLANNDRPLSYSGGSLFIKFHSRGYHFSRQIPNQARQLRKSTRDPPATAVRAFDTARE